MIIDLRGTHGAGKSTTARALMDLALGCGYTRSTVLESPGGRVQDYWLLKSHHPRISVLGRYETPTGGCDTIHTQAEVEFRIRSYATPGDHVFFEGVVVSTIFERYAKLARELPGYRFAFLNTPLEVCIERVRRRREERGNARPFDPERTLRPKWEGMLRLYDKCQAAGLAACWVDYLRADYTLWGWLH